MKISCPSCEAKYSIADEKVQGKVAKIRCKKCGATIVVGGQGAADSQPAAPAAAPSQTSYSVSVAEGDQRTMTLPELVDAYNQGVVTGDTYVWADGMDDWKAISDVPEILSALGGAGEPAVASEPPAEEPSAPAPEPVAAPAARRDSARKGVDLFGGGEAAAPAPMPTPMAAPSGPVGGDMGALTGARNEQSTLFSLNALQQAAEKGRPSNPGAAPEKKTNEDSGLIDLSALAKAASTEPAHAAPPLMMSAPVLGAPVLGAPAMDTAPVAAPPQPQQKSNTGLFIGVGIAVLGVAIAGAIIATRPSAPAPAAQPSTTAAAEPAKTAEPAPTATSTATDPEKAAPDASATGKTAAAPGKPAPGGAAKPGGAAAAKPDAPKAPDPPAAPPPPKAAANPCGCAPGDLMCNMKCSTAKKK